MLTDLVSDTTISCKKSWNIVTNYTQIVNMNETNIP